MVVNHLVHQGEMGVGLSVYRPLFQRLEHLEYLESWEIREYRSGKVSESSGKRIGSGTMHTTFSRCFASHFRHLIDYGIAIIMLLEQ